MNCVLQVEKRGDNLTGYMSMRPVAEVRSATLMKVLVAKIKPGAEVRTDALASYGPVATHGFTHLPETSLGGKRSAIQFKLVHRQISNFKSWLLGTHRNTCRRYLDLYTAEYSCRTNRRDRYDGGKTDNQEQSITDRLLTAMVGGKHWTWKRIRKQRWTRKKLSAAYDLRILYTQIPEMTRARPPGLRKLRCAPLPPRLMKPAASRSAIRSRIFRGMARLMISF